MDHNRSKKTKTVRTLIETNGERYEIQYEVGENEIDSIAQAQALQLFIDNYAATQTKGTHFQPQQEAPPPLQVQEDIMMIPEEEECILPDMPSQQPVLGHYAPAPQRQSVIHIDESDEERDDVKPDVKYVPPPPQADPDDLEAQISASVILVDEFKNAKMPANCSTNDSNSRSSRLSKEELQKFDSNVSFSNAYKAFAVSCPDATSPQLFKQRFNDKKRRYNWSANAKESSNQLVVVGPPRTPPPPVATPVTQTVVSQSTVTAPVQQAGAAKGAPLPKITTVWSAKSPVHSTNVNQQQVHPAVVPQLAAPLPQKVRRVAAPTPNITVTMSPTTQMSDPSNLLMVQSTKTLEQVTQEDEAIRAQRFNRGRGRAAKRHIEPPPSSIKTSVITSVPKVEKPDVPAVTYQTVAAPSPPVVAQTSQQTFSLNQPTAVCIDGQYYLLQAMPNDTNQPAQTQVQQINQAIQPIVAQSLQPFLQQHQQQQQLQPQQVYHQHVQAEQPAQDMYRSAPIMIVNQPNFHISSNTPTPVSATATTSSNNAGGSQTIILTDEQYNNYASQLHMLQQPQQQAHPVPIQLHQNPMSYTNQQQTQVIVRPVRAGQKTTKNLVVAGTEDLQFIEYQDLMNDVNSVSKKYY